MGIENIDKNRLEEVMLPSTVTDNFEGPESGQNVIPDVNEITAGHDVIADHEVVSPEAIVGVTRVQARLLPLLEEVKSNAAAAKYYETLGTVQKHIEVMQQLGLYSDVEEIAGMLPVIDHKMVNQDYAFITIADMNAALLTKQLNLSSKHKRIGQVEDAYRKAGKNEDKEKILKSYLDTLGLVLMDNERETEPDIIESMVEFLLDNHDGPIIETWYIKETLESIRNPETRHKFVQRHILHIDNEGKPGFRVDDESTAELARQVLAEFPEDEALAYRLETQLHNYDLKNKLRQQDPNPPPHWSESILVEVE